MDDGLKSYSMDTNIIYCGDNLEVLPKYIDDDSIDLIYIDPPFNTSRIYEVFWGEAQERRAFEDRFGDVMTYLEWMRPRIRELYRVLNSKGSFYYHCDWHASHYVKAELDRIFGFDNFRNEIVWCYKSREMSKKYWNRKHDVILFYTKSDSYQFHWERVQNALSDSTTKKYKLIDDMGRRYRLVGRGIQGSPIRSAKDVDQSWEIERPELVTRNYIKEGYPPEDWWVMDIINQASKERLGYPTQKPLALLERIINASSNENDVVLDAFCGCGTTLEAAEKLKRKWIGIDYSPTACRVMAERLEKRLGLKEGIDYKLKDMPKTVEQLRKMPPFEFENWAVVALGGIPNKVKVGDYGIDGRLYLADMAKEKQEEVALGKQTIFEELDRWYPIQVKQMDKVGRPDIDKFQTAMRRDKRLKGYFIAFGFSTDAIKEIKRAQKVEGLDILPITVDELLGFEKTSLS